MTTDDAIDWDEYSFEVVIPTIKDEILTLESIPDEVTVHVQSDGTLNEARNDGARAVDEDVVVIMDDDIAFPPEVLRRCVDHVDPDTLLGMADWNYGWIAGRVMIFHRSLWEAVGGFDERLRSHMGDTEFALNALEHGFDIERIPREVFYHREHERSIGTWDHVWRLPYLCAKYPKHAPRLTYGMVVYG